MPLPSSTSFTSLFSVSLPHPFHLHPDACNPSMDLIALLATADAAESAGPSGAADAEPRSRGKEKEEGWSTVALWRMSGSKVWEVYLGSGKVASLAWSMDGLILSLLICDPWPPLVDTNPGSLGPSNWFRIEQRSVHTGEIVRSAPVEIDYDTLTDAERKMLASQSWRMGWVDTGATWEAMRPGSALMVIDSLPRVTPVDPPKPAIINPFMMAKTKLENPKPHPLLIPFPVLLPSDPSPSIEPHLLQIHLTRPVHLLTGTFQIPTIPTRAHGPPGDTRPHNSYLHLARLSDSLAQLLDIVAQGLDAAGVAVKEGEKQTMIWREEVESCGEQQGMSKADVHADLFKLLLTGRCGPAVSEWLGNRMSNRVVAKWETALVSAFKMISKVIAESIAPALERIILILEEINNWSKRNLNPMPLTFGQKEVDAAMGFAKGLLSLVELMREEALVEMETAIEWFRWIKFEIARSAMITDTNSEHVTLATYDLKHAWAFLQHGFIHSTFLRHFPSLLGSVIEYLPEPVLDSHITSSSTSGPSQSLDTVLRDSLERLAVPRGGEGFIYPTPNPQDVSTTSSNMVSIVPDTPSRVFSNPEDEDDDGVPDSPDTVERKGDEDGEVDRRERGVEPKLWNNSLIKACAEVVKGALGGRGGTHQEVKEVHAAEGVWSQLAAEGSTRVVGGDTWLASVSEETGVLLARRSLESESISAAVFALSDAEPAITCKALQFFDDTELALVVQQSGGDDGMEGEIRCLVTVEYNALVDLLKPRSLESLASCTQPSSTLPITRSRRLEPGSGGSRRDDPVLIALNGRKGRRVGCVSMGDGTGVEVFDMDEDEDEEEEEEGDGEGEGEGDGEGGEEDVEME